MSESKPRKKLIHVILMMQDEIGQLKTVLDGRLESVSIDRKADGTGHIYGEFAPELSRENIEKLIEQAKKVKEEDTTPPPVEQVLSVEET